MRLTDGTLARSEFTIADKPDESTPITLTLPINPFVDVFGTGWFIDAVIYVYDKGLMTGTSTEPMLFSPHATLARSMVVTVLYRVPKVFPAIA